MRNSHQYIIIHFGLITLTIAFAGCTPANHPRDAPPDLSRFGARPINLSRMLPNPDSSEERPGDDAPSGPANPEETDDPDLLLTPMASFPNPFNPATVLSFALPDGGAVVSLAIHSIDGRLARQLVAANLPAGEHSVIWLGKDDSGRKLPSGVYFASLRSGGEVRIRKLVMVQ
jgi:hypothetical protein